MPGAECGVYGSSKALAATITNYYQGQPLHVSTRTQPLDFAIGDNKLPGDLRCAQIELSWRRL